MNPTPWRDRIAARLRHEVHFENRLPLCFVARPANAAAMVAETAARFPDREALVGNEGRLTYAALTDRAGRLAAGLADRGVRAGDRVAVLLGNRFAFVEAYLACLHLGAVLLPINVRQPGPEIAYAVNDSGAAALIHEAALAETLPQPADVPGIRLRLSVGGTAPGSADYEAAFADTAPPPASPDEEETAVILYTSGTTGKPKGAMLTHLNIVHSALHYRDSMALTEADRTLLAVPASHVTGLIANISAMLAVGGTTIVMERFRAADYLALAAAERATHTILVPAMYNLCLLHPDFDRHDLTAWRIGGYGGAPMPQATITTLAEKLPGMQLINAYGATETTSPATIMPPDLTATHSDSVGLPVACADIRVMDDDGREVEPGETGEIWVAGPMVVPGYWNRPAATAAAFHAGYWKSGDIGSIDENGFVRVFDRKKDMINRAGYKVYSAEVENILAAHPAVLECAVVGDPDPVLGERVRAIIVAKEGTRPDDELTETIRQFCRARLSDYKVPETVQYRADPLPRNANGKVIKTELRSR